jgi:hypothetical protein
MGQTGTTVVDGKPGWGMTLDGEWRRVRNHIGKHLEVTVY